MTTWNNGAYGVCWEQSDLLAAAGLRHGVTGRQGGVSRGVHDSLNLSFDTGDSALSVLENRRRFCCAVGVLLTAMTVPAQCGEDHVVAVGRAEQGCGAGSRESALEHADAVLTQLPGVMLTVLAADDVPVILFDPVQKACAISCAGWPGTAAKLAAKTVLAMEFMYGSRPDDMLAYIGPSVSAPHCEVSERAAVSIEAMGPAYSACVSRKAGRRTIDLPQAHRIMLHEAGLQPCRIDVTPSCTFEQPDRFFSVRRDYGRTGRMAAFAVII